MYALSPCKGPVESLFNIFYNLLGVLCAFISCVSKYLSFIPSFCLILGVGVVKMPHTDAHFW